MKKSRWFFATTLLLCAFRLVDPPGDDMLPLGFTECVGEINDTIPLPAAWINVNTVGTEDEQQVIAHERKHAEQVRRFTSCADWQAWLRRHRAESEAEAFCASIFADPMPSDSAHNKYALWLAHGYPRLRLDVTRADSLIRKYCP